MLSHNPGFRKKRIMTDLTVSLAGIPVGISAIYPTTAKFMQDYLCGDKPEFSVVISEDDIRYERKKSAEQDEADGISVRDFSDNYLETLAVLRKIAEKLPDYDAVLFHGTVVAADQKAYMFTAPSGTGKTTHARLWMDILPDAHILNGDKPFLKVTEQGIFACGDPWQGKERYGTNEILPLKSICILERAEENSIEKITFSDALPALVKQVYRPEASMLATLKLISELGQRTELYRLKCNTDPEAACVSIEEMTGHSM